jgi:hypothetical protein
MSDRSDWELRLAENFQVRLRQAILSQPKEEIDDFDGIAPVNGHSIADFRTPRSAGYAKNEPYGRVRGHVKRKGGRP